MDGDGKKDGRREGGRAEGGRTRREIGEEPGGLYLQTRLGIVKKCNDLSRKEGKEGGEEGGEGGRERGKKELR